MEAEVVAMVLSLYNIDPEEGAGAMTSGGTEVSRLINNVFASNANVFKHRVSSWLARPTGIGQRT
jgi:hypothetical protein